MSTKIVIHAQLLLSEHPKGKTMSLDGQSYILACTSAVGDYAGQHMELAGAYFCTVPRAAGGIVGYVKPGTVTITGGWKNEENIYYWAYCKHYHRVYGRGWPRGRRN